MNDSEGKRIHLRQRVRVTTEHPQRGRPVERHGWIDGAVVAISDVTKMVCVRYDTESGVKGSDTWWVEPANVRVL